MPLPLHGPQPFSSAPQGRSRPLGTIPRDASPAPQTCSFPLAFALSPPVCVLCGWSAADPDLCGQKIELEEFCLLLSSLLQFFASELFYWQDEESGVLGFLPEDIHRTVVRAAQKKCFVCGKNGAAITCCWEGCDHSFHLPCAMDGECITQYFALHSSFCRDHRPEQEVEAAPEKNTECLICLEPVEDRKSYHTMVCPACKHAWFHRGCIQVGAARYAGFAFNCPLCRNEQEFLQDMLTMGIQIPLRLVSRWLTGQEAASPVSCQGRCDARECLCPGGREQAEEHGPWELLLCSSCAAEGTHRHCSNLGTSRTSWECESCAGQGTGKRQSTFMPLGWGQGPGKSWQQVPRLGLAEPLCSRRAGAPLWPLHSGLCACDLTASPYSLQ
uniref:PHD finger protein 7 n=1 Tax=Strix occidentalis caurina TaxID=311401 RepID=A0A8D0EPA0_STROC